MMRVERGDMQVRTFPFLACLSDTLEVCALEHLSNAIMPAQCKQNPYFMTASGSQFQYRHFVTRCRASYSIPVRIKVCTAGGRLSANTLWSRPFSLTLPCLEAAPGPPDTAPRIAFVASCGGRKAESRIPRIVQGGFTSRMDDDRRNHNFTAGQFIDICLKGVAFATLLAERRSNGNVG